MLGDGVWRGHGEASGLEVSSGHEGIGNSWETVLKPEPHADFCACGPWGAS